MRLTLVSKLSLVSVLAATLTTSMVSAQNGQQAASAETLFREAKKQMDAENYEEACPKFAASQQLDPGIGTLLNLANCHDKQGLTASAWAEFVEAATLSGRAGQPKRQAEAQERADALEAVLIRVKIVVPEAVRVDGMAVKQDGQPVPGATWGVATPIDPGPHLISVVAPGKKEWAKAFDAEGEGTVVTIEVPALEDAPVEVVPPPETGGASGGLSSRDSNPGSGQRTVGVVVGVVGVLGLAAGSVFGLSARGKWNDAGCESSVCLTTDDQELAEDARSQANLSSAFMVGGGLLALAGIVLYAAAPDSSDPVSDTARGPRRQKPKTYSLARSFRVAPSVGRDGGGVWMSGRF